MNNPAFRAAIILAPIFYAFAANSAPVTADLGRAGKLTIDGAICTIDSDRTRVIVGPTGVHIDDTDDGIWEVKNNVAVQISGPKPTKDKFIMAATLAAQVKERCQWYANKLIGPEI